MSNERPESDEPTTETELQAALGQLFRAAQHNGVDVRGGWSVRQDGDGGPYLGVEVTEVVSENSGGTDRHLRE
ncbi:hypothetical protein ACFO0N_13805 [Halobium salinum]|uniref:Amphi-Trp domain-containing protein n=1 Tax=Halobium salinum TaxID=1364940 RepID=A0ABD5PDQ5_9EURY|nr:hypothetical protein [Halobium salinum]